ncbi:MAG: DUF2961 domain-containing protein [Treponema sp.]|nr:DUF2961 domain-containing protein [Treponema sp.]
MYPFSGSPLGDLAFMSKAGGKGKGGICALDEGSARNAILRMYWDGRERPSVECPVGDFFCSGCWAMPFRKSCRTGIIWKRFNGVPGRRRLENSYAEKNS